MKRTIISLLILMLLSSCSANATAATSKALTVEAPTLVPTKTLLPIFTPTQEAMVTATEVAGIETFDKPLKIISTDAIENYKTQGIEVNGAFMVDESARTNAVNEVTLPDALGAELLLKIVATIDWFHNSDPAKRSSGQPTDQDIAEFAKRMVKVQSGELPCSEVQSTIFAFDAQVPGNKMQEIPVALFCGMGEVPAGTRRIDKVEIVYVSAYQENEDKTALIAASDMPRFTIINGAGGGYETEIDGEVLRFKVGMDFLIDEANRHGTVPLSTAMLFRWIQINQGQMSIKISGANGYLSEVAKLEERGFLTK